MFKDLIEGFVKNQIKTQITKTIGIDSDGAADGAIHDVVGSLIWGLAKNSKSTEWANGLVAALDKDHDGSILDDALTIMQSEDKGAAIINHVLGDKASGIAALIGAKNGLDSAQVTKILATLAPIVMWFLGKEKKEKGLGIDDIVGLLANEDKAVREDKAEAPIAAFLDQDGDVDIHDLLKMAV